MFHVLYFPMNGRAVGTSTTVATNTQLVHSTSTLQPKQQQEFSTLLESDGTTLLCCLTLTKMSYKLCLQSLKSFYMESEKKMLFIRDHTKFYRPKLNLTLTKLKSLLTLVISIRPSRTLEAHFKHRAPEHSFYSFVAFDNLGWVAVAISTDKQQHQFPESQLSPSGLQLCASVHI